MSREKSKGRAREGQDEQRCDVALRGFLTHTCVEAEAPIVSWKQLRSRSAFVHLEGCMT